MNTNRILLLSLVFAFGPVTLGWAQQRQSNEDESKVDMGPLPELLVDKRGNRVTAENWESHRQTLVQTITQHQFGAFPSTPANVTWNLVESGTMFEGKTKREQFVVRLTTKDRQLDIDFVVFSPTNQSKCGGFLGLNFHGNHTVDSDPVIRLPSSWVRNGDDAGVTDNRASEKGRGTSSRRWPIQEINSRGFFVATAYYGDIDPDFDDDFANGVHALYPEFRSSDNHPDLWGSIAGWAWGLSRLMDVLVQQPLVDANKVAVVGHSRLGKTALWAGATDPRFSLVISNNSGCGGAAIERRNFGETVSIINKSFPHWFCRNFRQYGNNEKQLPHDAHTIIATMAPRPVYIASATGDKWADPKGEYLSGFFATPVYELLGYKGLPRRKLPSHHFPD